MNIIYFIFINLILIRFVSGHSWLIQPHVREAYPFRNNPDGMANEDVLDGCKYSRAYGFENTYYKGDEWSMPFVSQGREVCLAWASNGHFNDLRRGSVDFFIGNGTDNQDELFKKPLILDVDYAAYKGIKVKIPEDTPLGFNTIQFRWFYCGAKRLFVSCADIYVTDKDDTRGHDYGFREGFQGVRGQCLAGLPPIPDDLPVQGFCDFEDPDKKKFECEINLKTTLSHSDRLVIQLEVVNNTCTSRQISGNECHVSTKLNILDMNNITITGVDVKNDCGDEVKEEVCANPPAGYCCTDSDCALYCKNYMTKHSNGFWICQ